MTSKITRALVATSAFLLAMNLVPSAYADRYQASASSKKVLKKLFKSKGLTGVPNLAKAVKKNSSKGAKSLAVSGTPPTMEEIAEANIGDLFWNEGDLSTIISGSGDNLQDACNNFHAGLGSCQIAESFMRGFGTMLEAGTSMCYMSNFPAAASGVELLSGDYDGDLKDIFDPPAEGSRIVKIQISGGPGGEGGEGGGGGGPSVIMARIYGQDEVRAGGKMFRTELSFCDGEGATPTGYDMISADNSGKLTVNSAGQDGGNSGDMRSFKFVGRLAPTGNNKNIQFDPAAPRTAQISSIRDGGTEKNEINVNGGFLAIASRTERDGSVRNNYNKVRFAANAQGYAGTRLLDGAFSSKETGEYQGEFDGAMEFQDPRYVARNSHPLLDDVRAITFDEPFYTEAPSGDIDVDGLTQCDAEVDAVVALDMSDPAMQVVQEKCEPPKGAHSLCWDNETIRAAQDAYFANCNGGGGGGGPE